MTFVWREVREHLQHSGTYVEKCELEQTLHEDENSEDSEDLDDVDDFLFAATL